MSTYLLPKGSMVYIYGHEVGNIDARLTSAAFTSKDVVYTSKELVLDIPYAFYKLPVKRTVTNIVHTTHPVHFVLESIEIPFRELQELI